MEIYNLTYGPYLEDLWLGAEVWTHMNNLVNYFKLDIVGGELN
jgi:hypothetical protein